MACECLKKATEKLREQFNDPKGEFNSQHLMNFTTGKTSSKWPAMKFSYHQTKKDGSRYKNETSINLSANYCPICGTKYEESE